MLTYIEMLLRIWVRMWIPAQRDQRRRVVVQSKVRAGGGQAWSRDRPKVRVGNRRRNQLPVGSWHHLTFSLKGKLLCVSPVSRPGIELKTSVKQSGKSLQNGLSHFESPWDL